MELKNSFVYLQSRYGNIRFRDAWEHSSVGLERLPYKQRVGGSTPSAPTQKDDFSVILFLFSTLFISRKPPELTDQVQNHVLVGGSGSNLVYLKSSGLSQPIFNTSITRYLSIAYDPIKNSLRQTTFLVRKDGMVTNNVGNDSSMVQTPPIRNVAM